MSLINSVSMAVCDAEWGKESVGPSQNEKPVLKEFLKTFQ